MAKGEITVNSWVRLKVGVSGERGHRLMARVLAQDAWGTDNWVLDRPLGRKHVWDATSLEHVPTNIALSHKKRNRRA